MQYAVIDIILKNANNYYGELYDIDDPSEIKLYIGCLIRYKNKKYKVLTKEKIVATKRNGQIMLGKKVLHNKP